ncbi:MAG: Carboxy-terminal processing protease CtpB [Anaerolineales bacterium]|nr:S41 family peptidase [Anaerolineae bacterium]MBL8103963.1 S41 family peptidase [Anaerolineales bacterium]MBV6400241.1 Carboxy-terminal processing protease CtpB [Anaerolineales bacterium]MCC7187124.1 S41 family peptidase [Anaerolineales bacterium]HQU35697.1 S41 family peptidase [Anaerolineales bacterium]
MNKSIKIILGLFVGLILLAGVFSAGILVGFFIPGGSQPPIVNDLFPLQPTAAPEQLSATPEDMQTLFAPFWEAWNIVHSEFVDQPLDDVALMRGAIRGMMEAVGDKQTFYMDPVVYETETSALSGEYEGIGAFVDTTGEYLSIISPIEGSPAEAAGLKAGDLIIAIDGVDMTGTPPEEARQKVIGPAGTTVTLSVAREGQEEPLEFIITRAKITIPSVTGKMLENDIAYIDINQFGDKTTSELNTTLEELLPQNPKGIIIDLRNNGGGYLQTSIEVASEFIDQGVILYEQYGDGTRDTYNALGNGRATDLPIVVLVNEGSASASEILAGALRDYGRAKLVGVISYGKGSVQQWIPLSGENGAARVTVARWLTPKERLIDGIGLTPDFIVELTEDDAANNRDPQLDKAVEVLLDLIAGK